MLHGKHGCLSPLFKFGTLTGKPNVPAKQFKPLACKASTMSESKLIAQILGFSLLCILEDLSVIFTLLDEFLPYFS